jgi:hypothetical protein
MDESVGRMGRHPLRERRGYEYNVAINIEVSLNNN